MVDLARLHAESWRTAYRGMLPDEFLDDTVFRRELVAEVGPADPKGAPLVYLVQVSRDGRRYAYGMWRTLGTLVLIDGVKP